MPQIFLYLMFSDTRQTGARNGVSDCGHIATGEHSGRLVGGCMPHRQGGGGSATCTAASIRSYNRPTRGSCVKASKVSETECGWRTSRGRERASRGDRCTGSGAIHCTQLGLVLCHVHCHHTARGRLLSTSCASPSRGVRAHVQRC